MKEQRIREWYANEYPTDGRGEEINSDVTFEDLFAALNTYKPVSNVLGVNDSIVRERAFSKLATILNVDYGYIFAQWMNATD